MHRFRSKSAINRLRLAAFLLLAKYVLAVAAALLLLYSIGIGDHELIYISLGIVLLVVLMLILQWMLSARTQCPLCMTAVLARRGCVKHRNARRLLGSHRLRVSMAVLFTNSFRCPYCNEPTVLEVRGKYRY
jgi:hypothetical protein